MASYTAKQIAKYYIWLNKKLPKGELSNKKLNKILYYAQGWYTVLMGENLFNEDFEAWIHGPAIPSIYHEFKKFGWSNIALNIGKEDIAVISKGDAKILTEVWEAYGIYPASILERLTHSESPWLKARGDCPEYMGSAVVISKSDIKESFEEHYSYGKKQEEEISKYRSSS